MPPSFRLLLAAAHTLVTVYGWTTALHVASYNDRMQREFSSDVLAAAHFQPIAPHFGLAALMTVLSAFLWIRAIKAAER